MRGSNPAALGSSFSGARGTEADPSSQDREEESRADLLTGSREAHLSHLKEDPEEMIDLDQEEGKGAS